MRKTLKPGYIDREDMEIFRVVDRPEECVTLIKQGVKESWWMPLDEGKATEGEKRLPPLSGTKSDSGEGTRYGQRPKQTASKHARPSRKPQQ